MEKNNLLPRQRRSFAADKAHLQCPIDPFDFLLFKAGGPELNKLKVANRRGGG